MPTFKVREWTGQEWDLLSWNGGIRKTLVKLGASLVVRRLKRLPAMWETWVRDLGREDPWRKKWQPTPVFLPGESHGRRSLVGYSPRVAKSWTRLSDFTFTFFSSWRTSFRISVNASQEMKNSFRFSLLSLPHFWRTAWPGTVTLKIFISIVWMSSQSLMACKISSEKSTCCLVGGFLYVMSCFSFDFLQNSFFVFNFWQFIYNVSSCFCCCYSFATYFLTLLRLHGL